MGQEETWSIWKHAEFLHGCLLDDRASQVQVVINCSWQVFQNSRIDLLSQRTDVLVQVELNVFSQQVSTRCMSERLGEVSDSVDICLSKLQLVNLKRKIFQNERLGGHQCNRVGSADNRRQDLTDCFGDCELKQTSEESRKRLVHLEVPIVVAEQQPTIFAAATVEERSVAVGRPEEVPTQTGPYQEVKHLPGYGKRSSDHPETFSPTCSTFNELQTTSTSNFRFNFNPATSYSSFNVCSIPTNHGLGYSNTLDDFVWSNTLQTNGMTISNFLWSNASINNPLKDKYLCWIGLFLVNVNLPSQEPRFFK
ncbi:hypothetical protein OGAPHI_001206 [Ogataea philodendri]|uniref:Uncharacterized protein n=1 Tax=Ogataea philodendri TaxID=1378263 RepID=A0A9P8PF06_9ASCO|nr:uncharacterized protein OGAPHI_001206 [Ogataea philodendri]KAH3670691.1 hypothetical protein OGAPHI_001206 [Ogataea philodendri]